MQKHAAKIKSIYRNISAKSARDQCEILLVAYKKRDKEDSIRSGIGGSGSLEIDQLLHLLMKQMEKEGMKKDKEMEVELSRERSKEVIGDGVSSLALVRNSEAERQNIDENIARVFQSVHSRESLKVTLLNYSPSGEFSIWGIRMHLKSKSSPRGTKSIQLESSYTSLYYGVLGFR